MYEILMKNFIFWTIQNISCVKFGKELLLIHESERNINNNCTRLFSLPNQVDDTFIICPHGTANRNNDYKNKTSSLVHVMRFILMKKVDQLKLFWQNIRVWYLTNTSLKEHELEKGSCIFFESNQIKYNVWGKICDVVEFIKKSLNINWDVA